MNKILGGLVLSVFLAAPVMAADMPVKAPPAPVITLYSWTGCYIGGHVGFAWGKRHVDFSPNPFGLDFDHDGDAGFIGGGQIGCNLFQNDRWVLGIEGQASWADLDSHVSSPVVVTAGPNAFRTESDIIGSIAARLGYAFGETGQTLFFVKGGAAFIHEQFFVTSFGGFDDAQSDEKLRWGWMVGAGFEHAFGGNWSVKAEYNFSQFGHRDVDLCTPFGDCDVYRIKQHVHLFKVGLNYRFGGFGGPVVARY
jgi:outer membrane immunogenic protein